MGLLGSVELMDMATYSSIEDPGESEPRPVHVQSTEPVASALCGIHPKQAWEPSTRPATCSTCIAASRRSELRTFWRLHDTGADDPPG